MMSVALGLFPNLSSEAQGTKGGTHNFLILSNDREVLDHVAHMDVEGFQLGINEALPFCV